MGVRSRRRLAHRDRRGAGTRVDSNRSRRRDPGLVDHAGRGARTARALDSPRRERPSALYSARYLTIEPVFTTGDPGIEPGVAVLETTVLPIHQSPEGRRIVGAELDPSPPGLCRPSAPTRKARARQCRISWMHITSTSLVVGADPHAPFPTAATPPVRSPPAGRHADRGCVSALLVALVVAGTLTGLDSTNSSTASATISLSSRRVG